MKKFNIILVLFVLFGIVSIAEARTPIAKVSFKPDSAISRAVQDFTDRNSQGVGKVKIFKSDIQGTWALVWARATEKKLDDAQYLLHKEKGGWKVLTMGTALIGTGAEYKVPSRLRKKWNL